MIFKSRQVNLDPEPYVDMYGNRYADNVILNGMVRHLDPRPEFEPTRDPLPWYNPTDNWRYPIKGKSNDVWAPRREQFDTPVNPILVAYRDVLRHASLNTAEWAQAWLDADVWQEATGPDQIDHARRVLNRLAYFNREN